MRESNSKLVYSTGQEVPRKEKPPQKEIRPAAASSHQKVIVRLDKKGRKGKAVTVVEGLLMPQSEREALLSQFKTRFGTGGTATDAGFEIQGDHRDALMAALTDKGFRPRRSGG
jgi:translation initiation factor 1